MVSYAYIEQAQLYRYFVQNKIFKWEVLKWNFSYIMFKSLKNQAYICDSS